MKCPKCKYEWKTKSERMFVTCPNCLLKVKQNTNLPQETKGLNNLPNQLNFKKVKKDLK